MNLLTLTPVAAAASEDDGERVVVVRPYPQGLGLRTPFDWLIFLLAPRRLKLDELGSYCWRRLDGESTALQIASDVRARYGDAVEPAEERVGRFLQQLLREELIEVRDAGRGAPRASSADRVRP